ncbi:MAG: recombination mediator RecR [bacterium]
MQYTKPLAKLIEEFQKLPGIGPKSAQRMAFHLLKMPHEEVKNFCNSILDAKEKIKYCKICFNMSSQSPCEICSDERREDNILCVVAETRDLIALERTKELKGKYHVLQGLISPLDGIGPQDLRVKELLERCGNIEVKEIILALNPSIEGEATSLYLSKLLKPLGIKVTRISFGLPIGGDLDYADEVTIVKALEDRREM